MLSEHKAKLSRAQRRRLGIPEGMRRVYGHLMNEQKAEEIYPVVQKISKLYGYHTANVILARTLSKSEDYALRVSGRFMRREYRRRRGRAGFKPEDGMTMDNRIMELRKTQGYSREKLAQILGTNTGQVQKLEKGDRRLTLHWMRRIAAGLNCKPSDLLIDQDVRDRLDDHEEVVIQRFRHLDKETKIRFLKIAAVFADTPTVS